MLIENSQELLLCSSVVHHESPHLNPRWQTIRNVRRWPATAESRRNRALGRPVLALTGSKMEPDRIRRRVGTQSGAAAAKTLLGKTGTRVSVTGIMMHR